MLRAKAGTSWRWVIAGFLLGIGAMALYYEAPRDAPQAPRQAGEPLKLRLDYQLR